MRFEFGRNFVCVQRNLMLIENQRSVIDIFGKQCEPWSRFGCDENIGLEIDQRMLDGIVQVVSPVNTVAANMIHGHRTGHRIGGIGRDNDFVAVSKQGAAKPMQGEFGAGVKLRVIQPQPDE